MDEGPLGLREWHVKGRPGSVLRGQPKIPASLRVAGHSRRRHATDATYVCLARGLGTGLWTLAKALARNAADLGLPVQLVT